MVIHTCVSSVGRHVHSFSTQGLQHHQRHVWLTSCILACRVLQTAAVAAVSLPDPAVSLQLRQIRPSLVAGLCEGQQGVQGQYSRQRLLHLQC